MVEKERDARVVGIGDQPGERGPAHPLGSVFQGLEDPREQLLVGVDLLDDGQDEVEVLHGFSELFSGQVQPAFQEICTGVPLVLFQHFVNGQLRFLGALEIELELGYAHQDVQIVLLYV